ncbi:MAG: ABC transporter permease [Bacillota bacterium]
MNLALIISFLKGTIGAATPILYAATGEIVSQRSGIMNLGLEGVMLMGAVSGYMVVLNTSNLALGIFTAAAVGLLIGLLFAFLTVTLQADQVVSGLSITLFGTGLSGYIGKSASTSALDLHFPTLKIPLLSKIPVVGDVLFDQDLMVYVLYAVVIAACIFIYKTKWGMQLRTIGENPRAADTLGINVYRTRYLYACVGSVLTALGGAYLTLCYTPLWFDGMTAGKGWIAVALVIFSGWNPAIAALGAILFGGISVLSLRLQLIDTSISSHFISMLPYLCTVAVLLIFTNKRSRGRNPSPSSLGQPYDREGR